LSAGRVAAGAAALGAAAAGGYLGLVTGALPVDLGIGRRTRPLGPLAVRVAAPREVVYDAACAPYALRRTRAMRERVEILERGSDLVLAAHRTPIRGGLTAVTVETVAFDPPDEIRFRLVRGPVPYVTESFALTEHEGGSTTLTYTGTLGTDLWALGQAWGDVVARSWEAVVGGSLEQIRAEAERRVR
jgi:hypothetical protein